MHGKPEVVDPYLKLGLNVQLGHQVAHELSLFELGANLCLYFVFGVDGRKINLLLLISPPSQSPNMLGASRISNGCLKLVTL